MRKTRKDKKSGEIIRSKGDQMQYPTINQKAPDFRLPDQNNNPTTLKDVKGKWVVLYFYPKDDTPCCTVEAIDFTKANKQFKELNAVVVGIKSSFIN